MDQEQLDYLLQSQYLPNTRDLNMGSIGITPVLLQGTGLQTGTIGANPQLLTDASLQVGSAGANPELMTDQFLELGSMGANPFKGIQTIFPTNALPALSNLGGMTPNFGVAEEEDVEQVDYIGSKRNKFQEGIGKLFEFFQRFSPVAAIGRGINSLRNRMNTRKAIERNIQSDPQGDITTFDPITLSRVMDRQRIMNMQPTAQDRGRGSIPSRSSPTTSRKDTSPSSSYSQASYGRRG